MVNPAGLEPATCRFGNDCSNPSELRVRGIDWWTWHDLNVRPRPSQSRALIPLSYRSVKLAEATGIEPARAVRGDLANRCHTIRRRLHKLAEGTGLEPASDFCAIVFGTTALPVRLPFQNKCFLILSSLLTSECEDFKSHRARFQIHDSLCYKTDEGREKQCREHTSRHTSPEDGELADSRKAPSSSSGAHTRRDSLPSSRKKVFQMSKNK